MAKKGYIMCNILEVMCACVHSTRYGMDDGQFCVSSTYRDSYICFTKLLYYHLHLRIYMVYLYCLYSYGWWSHIDILRVVNAIFTIFFSLPRMFTNRIHKTYFLFHYSDNIHDSSYSTRHKFLV